MTEVVVPDPFDLFLKEASAKFDQAETADVIHELKRVYPTRHGLFDRNDSYRAFKQLYRLGVIDEDGDTKILEIMAEKSSKKEEVLKLISDYRESALPCKTDFVGRDDDVSTILKRVTNPRVPGINLFGESGVGKTTLAKEVAQKLKDFEKVFIDLRDIKAIDNVFSIALFKLDLPSWDGNNKDRIYNHLQNLTGKTVLILDNIEQLLSKKNQPDQERVEFLEFLDAIVGNEASKKGYLKVILTSRIEIKEPKLKAKLFTEYNVQPFSKEASKALISKRLRSDVADVDQDEALIEIAKVCHYKAYFLGAAEQLMREDYCQPKDVLKKIKNKLESFQKRGVPEELACISVSFDSLPSDHLKKVAVRISLLRRPFSVSTAMKIAEIPSDYDAELDLELLVRHKIITAEDVDGRRKYDLHALFREFVTSYLCKEDSVYEEQLESGKKHFFEHFSGKLTKLAQNLEKEFVKTYTKLEVDRANYELTLELSEKNKETFEQLLHTDNHNKFALMGILFEVLKDEKERRELFGKWADAAEKQGLWLISALMRCWQSIQGSNLEGKLNEKLLEKAKESIEKAKSTTSPEKLGEVNCLFFHCRGKIKYMSAKKLPAGERKGKIDKELLYEGIDDLKEAVRMRQELNGDSTLTARALNLIGNCYMNLEDPLTAKTYYQKAMNMMKRLVGSEKHWEFPTYFNQMAQVHDMLGRAEEKWYNRFFGLAKKARQEYEEAVKWMEKALTLQEELGVGDTLHTAIFQRNLANIFIGLQKYQEALKCAEKSHELRKQHLGNHPETVRILYLIGTIYKCTKDHEAALQNYKKAFEMEESLSDHNHNDRVVREKLCDALEKSCKYLKQYEMLKGYAPRIKKIKKTAFPSSPEPSGTGNTGPEDIPDTHIEPEDIPDTHTEPEDIPDTHTEPEDIPDTHTEPEDIPDTHTEPEDIPDTHTEPEDIPDTHTEPEDIFDTHTGPQDTHDTHTEPEDIPDTHTEPQDTHDTHTGPQDTHDTHTEPEDTGFAIHEIGGSYSVWKRRIFLEVPPNAVSKPAKITCKVQAKDCSTTLAGDEETLVSDIVELGPKDIDVLQPITVTLVHSGPSQDLGYETVVKAFNQEKNHWEEIEELRNKSSLQGYSESDYIQVNISKLTKLAVVSRLITDRFEVIPDKKCVVTSSVCDDITLEFPEGAVDKTVEATMKVILVDKKNYEKYNLYPCPILCVNGFKGISFQKSPTIRLPRPCTETYPGSKISLFCLEDTKKRDGNEMPWEDITEEIAIKDDEAFIELNVRHFSWLFAFIGESKPSRGLISSIFGYFYETPSNVYFAAFKKNEDPYHNFRLRLLCVENKHRNEELETQDLTGYEKLMGKTGPKAMRIADEAYVKIKGDFKKDETNTGPVFLRFLGKEGCYEEFYVCKNDQTTMKGNEKILILFHTENQEDDLCKLSYKIQRQCQAHSSDDVYKMTSNPRGLFIIINMEKFDDENKLKERKGSEVDARNLEELFKDYGFETEVLRNMNKQYLLSYLERIAENRPELENHDCFGLCIMSHGKNDYFYASDGGTINVTEIRDMFKNSKCEGLKGKPKLFFIQACRGRSIDHGVRIRSDSPHRRSPGNQDVMSSVQRQYNERTIPEDADILMAYGCVEGHESYRDEQHGSFFIRSLVEVFREHYLEEDLMSMLTRVNKKVSELVGIDGAKQIPKPETTLRKKVFFS